jgi:hypothetical protein
MADGFHQADQLALICCQWQAALTNLINSLSYATNLAWCGAITLLKKATSPCP